MTVGEWVAKAELRLTGAGVNSPRLEARLLAATVLDADWTAVFAHPEWNLNEERAEELLARRAGREPLAYILGWREFYGRRFTVTPAVLIPRQETEVLVDQALESIDPSGEPYVLDLGCGSGCIGITIKLERPQASVLGSDISPDAISVARGNANRLGSDVGIICSDAFEKMAWRRFELIVSNPPYIADSEELMPDVAHFEPASALYSGATGLEFYERLAAEARGYLKLGGRILMEVGYTQAADVRSLFEASGWRHLRTTQDLSGVDRVLEFGL